MPYCSSHLKNKRYKKQNKTTMKDTMDSTIDSMKSTNSINPTEVKNADIIIYSMKDCPFCIILKETLKNNNLLDKVTIVEDRDKIPPYISNLPYSISKKTGKTFIGNPPTIEEYVNALL